MDQETGQRTAFEDRMGQGTAAPADPGGLMTLGAVPDTALGEERLHAQARAFLRASKAPSTLRAYRSDWDHFTAWCQGRYASFLPAAPETVALYLVALAETHRPATLTRRLTSIAKAHAAAGHPSPASLQFAVVAETLQGIRRTLGTAQPGKTALLTADLVHVLAHLPRGWLESAIGRSCSSATRELCGGRNLPPARSKIWSGSPKAPS